MKIRFQGEKKNWTKTGFMSCKVHFFMKIIELVKKFTWQLNEKQTI